MKKDPKANMLRRAVEIIPNKLYFKSTLKPLKDTENIHYFSVDDKFIYEPFMHDFGPINLGQTHTFCKMLEAKLAVNKIC